MPAGEALRETERRQVIIPVLLVPMAIGLAALAAEAGLWFADRHELRAMADAAAMAAGWARRESEDIEDAALAAAETLGFDDDIDDLDVEEPPTSGAYLNDDTAVAVTITRTRSVLLAAYFLGEANITITARAVVQNVTRSADCIRALSSSASDAVNFQGGPTVVLDGCGVHSDSSASDALNVAGNAKLYADWAQVRGGYNQSGAQTVIDLDTDEPPETNQKRRLDPYASLAEPTIPAACGGGTAFAAGCTFSGNKTFNNGDAVTFAAGTYVVDGGTLKINGGASLSGTDVTIFLTNGASIDVLGGATVNLTAPSTGTYAGIAIYQDRGDAAGTSKFAGGSTMNVNGVLYMPTQAVQFTGGNALGGGCTRIIANTVTFTGNATLGNDCTGLGLSDTVDDDPRLVE